MQFALKETRLGLLNSATRIPFRYGVACLTRCPQAVLAATIETDGKTHTGYSGDCLPPSWFDKSPDKDYRRQIDDQLACIAVAEEAFSESARQPVDFFSAWRAAYDRVHAWADERNLPGLLASFGVSLVERAIMDALARAAGLSFHEAVQRNIYAINAGEIHLVLIGMKPADWLPAKPLDYVYVRHTVGLSDPLTAADISPDERLDDGFPQALEEYVEQTGVRYFKVKIKNDLQTDRDRLLRFAQIVERHRGDDYQLTLDGNEQYKNAADFEAFVDRLQSTPELDTLWNNTIAIEQPLARHIALDENHTAGIRELCRHKRVIIDESDGTLDAYPRALRLGYRGTSSKSCKGPVKSLLNAGITWLHNDRGRSNDYLMTGEDLCCVGIVPLQADLCLLATLGITHAERNGHHYLPGLTYLSEPQQRAALAAHTDLYAESHGRIAPAVRDGRFEIGLLQCAGFGFAVEPDLDEMHSPEEWSFDSLGLS